MITAAKKAAPAKKTAPATAKQAAPKAAHRQPAATSRKRQS